MKFNQPKLRLATAADEKAPNSFAEDLGGFMHYMRGEMRRADDATEQVLVAMEYLAHPDTLTSLANIEAIEGAIGAFRLAQRARRLARRRSPSCVKRGPQRDALPDPPAPLL